MIKEKYAHTTHGIKKKKAKKKRNRESILTIHRLDMESVELIPSINFVQA